MLTIQLDSIVHDFQSLIPEVLMVGMLLLFVVLDLLFKNSFYKILPWLFITALTIFIAYFSWKILSFQSPQRLFFNMLIHNKVSVYFKILFDLATLVLLASQCVRTSKGNAHSFYRKPEFYFILVGILTGLHFMAMASHLITAYLSLELVSLSGYLLATMGSGSRSTEAGMKYLLFGSISSAIMLYGMSLLYGLTGTLEFSQVFQLKDAYGLVALVMMLAGILFKMAASPFHLWAPDVYEGAPAPLSAYLSVAPKAGGFAMMISVLSGISWSDAMGEQASTLLAFIAIITISIGNFSALWQNNAKRMLAYSSIAHTGFALGALSVLSSSGKEACLYYLGVYLFMNFAAFLIVDFLSESIGSEDVNKFKGLGVQVPVIGVIFVFIMIALTGLPPTAGFYAKFFVFSSMWEFYTLTSKNIFLLLFVFGLFNTVVSLFYYLKIPFFLFFKSAGPEIQISATNTANIFFFLLAAPLLVLFLKPDLLLGYINFLFK